MIIIHLLVLLKDRLTSDLHLFLLLRPVRTAEEPSSCRWPEEKCLRESTLVNDQEAAGYWDDWWMCREKENH